MAALVALGTAGSLDAQVRYRVGRQENVRAQPGPVGALLGTVMPGATVTGSEPRDGWVEVTLDGWIWSRSVGATAREGFDLTVTAGDGENLRSAPNGAVRARLREGFLLRAVERRPGWVRVRRAAWVWAQSLVRLDAPAATAPATPPVQPAVPDSQATLDRATLGVAAPVAQTAAGDSTGQLAAGTPVRVLGRAEGWARVQVELWVPESALRSGGTGVLVGVSAAEVRARPDEFTGQVLQWRVQVIGRQTADELRPELPAGAPYLLVRGPLPETAFAYVLIPDAWLARAEALEPLTEVVLLGRVRVARTRYLGNPVLDLLDLQSVGR